MQVPVCSSHRHTELGFRDTDVVDGKLEGPCQSCFPGTPGPQCEQVKVENKISSSPPPSSASLVASQVRRVPQTQLLILRTHRIWVICFGLFPGYGDQLSGAYLSHVYSYNS